MNQELTFTIASTPDREELTAELWRDDVMWGEISAEQGSLAIQIYPHPSGKPWSFELGEFENVIRRAKGRLLELRGVTA